MKNAVRWPSGKAFLETKSVGPRHDPYERRTVHIVLFDEARGIDKDFELVDCALAGRFLIDRDGARYEDGHELYDLSNIVYLETGFTPDFWLDTLWYKLSKRRATHLDYPMYL